MKDYQPSHTIRIDYREQHSVYVQQLQRDSAVKIEAIDSADVVIDDLGIERKTVRDFFSTLEEGRLWEQIYRLKNSYPRHLLLVEGYGMRYHLDDAGTMGVYIRLAVGWQIPIIHTRDGVHTAPVLKSIVKEPRRRRNIIPSVAALMCVPGVGEARAFSLLGKFGSLRGVFNASIGELVKVKGIGKTRAEVINGMGRAGV